jgi:uroporphyrinogen III methyltransferase/synthase
VRGKLPGLQKSKSRDVFTIARSVPHRAIVFGRQVTSSVRSLAGKRIVVTRARAQAEDLGNQLAALGAEVIYCPAIRIAPPEDPMPFERAVHEISHFDWVVITSANGVAALVEEWQRQGAAREGLATLRVACVGPATAEALRRAGIEPQAMPEKFVGAEIAAALAERIRRGERKVLLLRAAGGDPELPRRLRELGAEVREVESYRSVPDLENLSAVRADLEDRAIDVITFTSPSAATFFLEASGWTGAEAIVAAIGPVTAARLSELGVLPQIVADEHTAGGLAKAIADFFEYGSA